MPIPTQQKLSIREKLAYGLGDSAANFVGATQATFLLFFYTDVLGISAKAAGTILLVSRLVDAFNDPIMGALADRTNTRWGRYRPWVLWTAVPHGGRSGALLYDARLQRDGKGHLGGRDLQPADDRLRGQQHSLLRTLRRDDERRR